MQIITERNKTFWELELEAFETFLLNNDEQLEKRLPTLLSWRFLKPQWSLVCLAFFVIGRHVIAFLFGIHPDFLSFFPLEVLFGLLGFVFAGICLVTTITRVLRRHSFVSYALIWIIITALNFIPGIIPSAAGAVVSLVFAGPQQVVEEGRYLLADYEASKDVNCDYAFPPCGQTTDYPPAIRRLNPVYIRVTSEYVLIKKFGIGDVAGFIVYPSGTNPEGIKLIDGLYWTDAW